MNRSDEINRMVNMLSTDCETVCHCGAFDELTRLHVEQVRGYSEIEAYARRIAEAIDDAHEAAAAFYWLDDYAEHEHSRRFIIAKAQAIHAEFIQATGE